MHSFSEHTVWSSRKLHTTSGRGGSFLVTSLLSIHKGKFQKEMDPNHLSSRIGKPVDAAGIFLYWTHIFWVALDQSKACFQSAYTKVELLFFSMFPSVIGRALWEGWGTQISSLHAHLWAREILKGRWEDITKQEVLTSWLFLHLSRAPVVHFRVATHGAEIITGSQLVWTGSHCRSQTRENGQLQMIGEQLSFKGKTRLFTVRYCFSVAGYWLTAKRMAS